MGDESQCISEENGDCKGLEKINLLLVGKTGAGKSTTGNTILRQTVFKTSSTATSVTKHIEAATSEYKGYVLKVVDTPGVCDTDMSKEELTDILVTSMSASPEGYHALLLVVRYGYRFTKEDEGAIETLKDIFGEETVKNNIILIVNGGESFDTEEEAPDFNEWCLKQTGNFRRLLEECSRRVVYFANKTKDKKVIDRQIDQLIEQIRWIRKSYSSDDLKKAEEIRTFRIQCAKAFKNIYDDFKSLGNYGYSQLSKLEHLKKEAQNLEEILVSNLKKDTKLIDQLNDSRELLSNINYAVNTAIENKPRAETTAVGSSGGFWGNLFKVVRGIFRFFFS
ncbi:uncharacterized protein LOC131953992 [Physella acuta]|uniref:uncharacterized protein LOC131953992 n=1 Tax=Physella acuta TaxID=109671 RepID=UPI0027DB749A|nr:uncharacterized protein LOC131953992 [Physella acuta]